MDTDTTNLVGGDDTADNATVTDDAGVAAEGQQIEDPQYDDDGNLIEPPAEDEEVEFDDLKLKVPKDQAQKVREALLRQGDYTRKTQELADSRKAFDAEKQSFQQASQAELATAGQIMEYDRQLAQYAQVNWQQWQYVDPDAAQSAFMAWQQLKDNRAGALGHLNNLRAQRTSVAQQDIAKRAEQTAATLAKDIPGWNDATEAQVRDFAIKGFGFTADEMADMKVDPRIAKAFHRLHVLEQAEAKRNKAQGHVAAQAVKPAARAGGGSSAPPTGLDDRLGIDEWMRRANERDRKRKR